MSDLATILDEMTQTGKALIGCGESLIKAAASMQRWPGATPASEDKDAPSTGILTMRKGIGGVIMFLVKLPFRIAALPVILAMMVIHFVAAIIADLSSVITILLGTMAIGTAACIWMFQLGTDADAYGMLAFGIALIVFPHVAEWLLNKATDITGRLIAFVIP